MTRSLSCRSLRGSEAERCLDMMTQLVNLTRRLPDDIPNGSTQLPRQDSGSPCVTSQESFKVESPPAPAESFEPTDTDGSDVCGCGCRYQLLIS
eukprot:2135838-Rhodomonas_salina.2